jgi:sulfur-carrier protein
MKLCIKLFANLAETRGWREKTLEIAANASVLDAWRAATGEDALPPRVLCAINMNYGPPDQPLKAGDEVAFFPPVTGG